MRVKLKAVAVAGLAALPVLFALGNSRVPVRTKHVSKLRQENGVTGN